MKIMKILIPLCLIFVLTVNSYAASGGAAFLKKGVGARALGMGGAYTSVSNDISAVYWNPAGLGQVQDYSVSLMGSSGASDEYPGQKDIVPTHNFAAFSIPVSKFTNSLGGSVFALGLINSDMKNITLSNESGEEIGSFSDSQNAVFLSWGMPVWESDTKLYVGLSLKYIMEKMDVSNGNAYGYDVDAGILYNIFDSLNFGLFLSKGADMEWDGGKDNAPLTARFGVSNIFGLTNKMFLLGSADLVQRKYEPLGLNAGLELGYLNIYEGGSFELSGLFLRGGIADFAIEDRHGVRNDINENLTYTVGFGMDIMVFGKYLQIEYALGLGNVFDEQSKISLNFYF